jgi:hypothetical protein
VSSRGATHRVFAVSATTPFDDAERWAADIEATPPSEVDELDGRYFGGVFARPAQPRPIPRPSLTHDMAARGRVAATSVQTSKLAEAPRTTGLHARVE